MPNVNKSIQLIEKAWSNAQNIHGHEKEERQEYVEVKGRYSCISDRGGKMERSGKGRETCKECSSGEVEDVYHWILRCPAWDIVRQPLVEEVSLCHGFQGQCLEKQTPFVLSMACTQYSIINHLSAMWFAKFGS